MKIQDLYFGKIVSGNSGTVILSPNGDFPRTTGGVALQTNAGTYASALFEISDGLDNSPTSQHIYTGYSISLPTQDVVMIGESGETMTVGNFTSNSSPSGYGNFVNGNGILRVGATLHVGPFQGIGKYISSAPFQVTVNFY